MRAQEQGGASCTTCTLSPFPLCPFATTKNRTTPNFDISIHALARSRWTRISRSCVRNAASARGRASLAPASPGRGDRKAIPRLDLSLAAPSPTHDKRISFCPLAALDLGTPSLAAAEITRPRCYPRPLSRTALRRRPPPLGRCVSAAMTDEEERSIVPWKAMSGELECIVFGGSGSGSTGTARSGRHLSLPFQLVMAMSSASPVSRVPKPGSRWPSSHPYAAFQPQRYSAVWGRQPTALSQTQIARPWISCILPP